MKHLVFAIALLLAGCAWAAPCDCTNAIDSAVIYQQFLDGKLSATDYFYLTGGPKSGRALDIFLREMDREIFRLDHTLDSLIGKR
jgi:hypothetical protein